MTPPRHSTSPHAPSTASGNTPRPGSKPASPPINRRIAPRSAPMPDREAAKRIFMAALDLDPAQRPALITKECKADAALQREVEALLAAHEGNPILDPATLPAQPANNASPKSKNIAGSARVGEEIGPYRLLERIGEGGFGEVWIAEQKTPVRRKVALKIIKAGMDTREVLARFEAERQALAVMDHPSVAKVFDAGATAGGRPYFVMEFVAGLPINAYCDSAKLRIKERLALFMSICHAVQHAHQKGIIHRDLKPGNIIVTLQDGKPVPKVIDFGIAKATVGRLTERTLHTETGRVIGTPEYMAPEQAGTSGLDVDTRADIYSLGVILYELLTGTLPLDGNTLRSAGIEAVGRMLNEFEPPKPSTRLSTLVNEPVTRGRAEPAAIAKTHGADLRTLQRELRGDLDWITLKALEKDRTRRYETASAFAADVDRHLTGEPVIAAPPSVGYRVKKFVRKHRARVIAAGIIGVMLVVSTIVVTIAWRVTRASLADQTHQRAIAEKAAAKEVLARKEAVAERQRADKERDTARDAEKKLKAQADRARSGLRKLAEESNYKNLAFANNWPNDISYSVETIQTIIRGMKELKNGESMRISLGGKQQDDIDQLIEAGLEGIRESKRQRDAANAAKEQAEVIGSRARQGLEQLSVALGVPTPEPAAIEVVDNDGELHTNPNGDPIVYRRAEDPSFDPSEHQYDGEVTARATPSDNVERLVETALEAACLLQEQRDQAIEARRIADAEVRRAKLAEADRSCLTWEPTLDSFRCIDYSHARADVLAAVESRAKYLGLADPATIDAIMLLACLDDDPHANVQRLSNAADECDRQAVPHTARLLALWSRLAWSYAAIHNFEKAAMWIQRVRNNLMTLATKDGPQRAAEIPWLGVFTNSFPETTADVERIVESLESYNAETFRVVVTDYWIRELEVNTSPVIIQLYKECPRVLLSRIQRTLHLIHGMAVTKSPGHRILARAHYRLGNFDAALREFENAGDLSGIPDVPAQSADLAYLAMTRFKLGDHEGAQQELAQLRNWVESDKDATNRAEESFSYRVNNSALELLAEATALIEDSPSP
ncbi:hypothetical protein B7486_06985 [cyanobacterium TDX16]|nr:hypothetical protein B7486_06985 [cyanobacterium TDX16]